jgi:hypothetical protein
MACASSTDLPFSHKSVVRIWIIQTALLCGVDVCQINSTLLCCDFTFLKYRTHPFGQENFIKIMLSLFIIVVKGGQNVNNNTFRTVITLYL